MEVTRLGLDIADQLQQPRGRLAESVAEMCLNHGVVELIITTHQAQISISRDEIPALKTVEAKRTRGSVRQSQERHPSFPLQVDNAVSQSKIEAVHSSEFVAQQGEILAGLGRPRVGRMYTVVGTLRAPDSRGNVVPHSSGQFRTHRARPTSPAAWIGIERPLLMTLS